MDDVRHRTVPPVLSNPVYGRFLNLDTTEILEKTKGIIHGANLFAYCNNNPVMNVDYTGEDWRSDSVESIGPIGVIIIFVITVITVSIIAKQAEKSHEELLDQQIEKWSKTDPDVARMLEEYKKGLKK